MSQYHTPIEYCWFCEKKHGAHCKDMVDFQRRVNLAYARLFPNRKLKSPRFERRKP